MSNDRFRSDFRKLLVRSGQRAELVVRASALAMFGSLIQRSPVGNPDGWKANAGVVADRKRYLVRALAYNATAPKRRMGTSRTTLNKKFRLKAGRGYVGGRFKSNWAISYDSLRQNPAMQSPGFDAEAAAQAALKAYQAGATIYLQNAMPYSRRLENGYSKQAPNGMIRLTVLEFRQHVLGAAREVYGR